MDVNLIINTTAVVPKARYFFSGKKVQKKKSKRGRKRKKIWHLRSHGYKRDKDKMAAGKRQCECDRKWKSSAKWHY